MSIWAAAAPVTPSSTLYLSFIAAASSRTAKTSFSVDSLAGPSVGMIWKSNLVLSSEIAAGMTLTTLSSFIRSVAMSA
jgi:hypothetical protein